MCTRLWQGREGWQLVRGAPAAGAAGTPAGAAAAAAPAAPAADAGAEARVASAAATEHSNDPYVRAAQHTIAAVAAKGAGDPAVCAAPQSKNPSPVPHIMLSS